ncbi:hypothetical protein [Cognatilysobacter lacus]|uniref:Uncharacterized protein n=1 Tax=Cognatilysobacter lacus TaxID=1643323 RepID=A0A5D8Z2J9_9GAMM|nr:hypothetical protein [Lysobacter lacus]TZF88766.1 hypothetical protein FW784_09485 [Lysobacter lacus]
MSLPIRQLLMTVMVSALPLAAAAQSAPTADPYFVIARTVEPRNAYRGLAERTDNPVRAQAPVFPATAFGRAMGGLAVQGVDDTVLGALDAGNFQNPGNGRSPSFMPDGLGLGPTGQGTAPGGVSGAGDAIGHATGGIGGIVTSTLSQALGSIGGHP